MAHIHEKIDFTVGAAIVYDNKVLLIHHKKLNLWLLVGGHIELDENPEYAILREVKEESGLDIELVGEKPSNLEFGDETGKFLLSPRFMDIHNFSSEHQHIGMVYFAKAKTDKVQFLEEESTDIKWFSQEELEDPRYNILPRVKFYARKALAELAK